MAPVFFSKPTFLPAKSTTSGRRLLQTDNGVLSLKGEPPSAPAGGFQTPDKQPAVLIPLIFHVLAYK